MNFSRHPARPASGFTLVELLVVIGIIALLISILLPALNSARRAATTIKCLANLKSLGNAINMYANDNKGVIIPSIFWGPGSDLDDSWPFALVAGRYLPLPPGNYGDLSAQSGGVFVCPAVRDSMIYRTPAPGFVNVDNISLGFSDGFSRRMSKWMLTKDVSPLRASPANGINGTTFIDVGYGINGGTNAATNNDIVPAVGMFATSTSKITGTVTTCHPVNKITRFRRSTQTVLLFDGSDWSPWATQKGFHTRISGARHGSWQKGGGGTDPRPFQTGTTNILFLDGHAAGVNRDEMPSTSNGNAFLGDATQAMNNRILWNVRQ